MRSSKSSASAEFGGILQSLQRLERFFSAQRICENADFAAFPEVYDQRRMRPARTTPKTIQRTI
jgi:hypothetical protein